MKKLKIGFAMCGSFCTLGTAINEMGKLKNKGHDILPIMSFNTYNLNTKFGTAQSFIEKVEKISDKKIISSIVGAEPIGPQKMVDIMVVAPCSGNTMAKVCNAVTDTPVTMAVKTQLRICRPVVIAIATNDALGASAKNIAFMLNTKNVYFVPFGQDDPIKKPNSLVCKFDLLYKTIKKAMKKEQIQPVLSV